MDATSRVNGTWESDFTTVIKHLEPSQPCYILYRTDDISNGTYLFLFFSYVPDTAKVREKMLYASTRASLTKELGDNMFRDQYYGNKMDDFSWSGYQRHCQSQAADAPLTARESELENIKLAESGADISVSSKRAHVSGLSVPVDDAVNQHIQGHWNDLSSGNNDISKVLILKLDLDRDNMLMMAPEKQDPSSLTSLPANEPRYILIRIQSLTVFTYYCPGSAAVRQRMIYASSRANVVAFLESTGVVLDRKMETSDGADLTTEALLKELGLLAAEQKPNDSTAKHGFIRKGVAGPGGGPRRLVK